MEWISLSTFTINQGPSQNCSDTPTILVRYYSDIVRYSSDIDVPETSQLGLYPVHIQGQSDTPWWVIVLSDQ